MKSVSQLSGELHVPRQVIYKALKQANVDINSLPHTKNGKSVLYDDGELEIIKNAYLSHRENMSQNMKKPKNDTSQEHVAKRVLELEIENTSLKHQLEELEHQISAGKFEIEKTKEEITTIHGVIDTKDSEIVTLREELAEENQRNAALENDIAYLRGKLEEQDKSREAMKAAYDQLAGQNENLNERLHEANAIAMQASTKWYHRLFGRKKELPAGK